MPGNFANVEESAATPDFAAASFRASRRLRFAKLVTHFPPLMESRSVFRGCKSMQLLPPLEPCKAGILITVSSNPTRWQQGSDDDHKRARSKILSAG